MDNYEKITLGEIISDVRDMLDDDQFEASRIARAANDFQNELFTRYKLGMAESSDTLTVSVGDTQVDFPTDMMTLLEMTIVQGPTNYANLKNNYVSYERFMREFANYSTAASAQPSVWTNFGNGARFSRPSNGNYTINIDYLRLPVVMAAPSDECELRKVWREVMNLGTLARVMELNEDYAEAAQERDKLDPYLATFVTREGRGMNKTGPLVIGTRRRGRRE